MPHRRNHSDWSTLSEEGLISHIMTLRERLAAIEQDVAHLEDDQSVHSGRQGQTEQALAHIAWSLKDAHRLLNLLQTEALTRLGRLEVRIDGMQDRKSLTDRMVSLVPLAGPAAMVIIAILTVVLSLSGHREAASVLGGIKPPG